MRQSHLLTVLCCIIFPTLVATTASAQTVTPDPASVEVDERGAELFTNGLVLYDEGQYEAAIIAWQEGWDTTREPLFLFNIASAQERIGDYDSALATLNEYRALAPSDERDALSRRISALESRRDAAAEDPTSAGDQVPEIIAPTGDAVVVAEPIPADEPRQSRFGALQWTLVGTTVVGLGLGTSFGILANSEWNEAEALCSDSGFCFREADEHRSAGESRALVSDIGWIVAGTSFAVLLATVLTGGDEDSGSDNDSAQRQLHLSPMLIQAGGGITLGGTL